jgi:hypothetical protein
MCSYQTPDDNSVGEYIVCVALHGQSISGLFDPEFEADEDNVDDESKGRKPFPRAVVFSDSRPSAKHSTAHGLGVQGGDLAYSDRGKVSFVCFARNASGQTLKNV